MASSQFTSGRQLATFSGVSNRNVAGNASLEGSIGLPFASVAATLRLASRTVSAVRGTNRVPRMIDPAWNPAVVDPSLDSRAATFENPTGARGAGGAAHAGRKGAPNRRLEPGERVVLADIEGPGIVR